MKLDFIDESGMSKLLCFYSTDWKVMSAAIVHEFCSYSDNAHQVPCAHRKSGAALLNLTFLKA